MVTKTGANLRFSPERQPPACAAAAAAAAAAGAAGSAATPAG